MARPARAVAAAAVCAMTVVLELVLVPEFFFNFLLEQSYWYSASCLLLLHCHCTEGQKSGPPSATGRVLATVQEFVPASEASSHLQA